MTSKEPASIPSFKAIQQFLVHCHDVLQIIDPGP
jgi:hypothetical protein